MSTRDSAKKTWRLKPGAGLLQGDRVVKLFKGGKKQCTLIFDDELLCLSSLSLAFDWLILAQVRPFSDC